MDFACFRIHFSKIYILRESDLTQKTGKISALEQGVSELTQTFQWSNALKMFEIDGHDGLHGVRILGDNFGAF